MKRITVENTNRKDFHQFMLGGVTPRPIALVSTLDQNGVRNLAPYSYFNAVSSFPPILMVSMGLKPDGSKKDSLLNIEQNGEFVVNMVPYSLIRQMAMTSVMIPPSSDEFDLAGLKTIDSTDVSPYRVKGSPIQFECKLNQILELGNDDKSNHLVFGNVQCIHIEESMIDGRNRIDPAKLDIVGRLGRSYYTRTGDFSLETVVMPQLKIPIGFEKLPKSIRQSEVLTGNELAKLASLYEMPEKEEIDQASALYTAEHPGFSFFELEMHLKSLIKEGANRIALSLALGLS